MKNVFIGILMMIPILLAAQADESPSYTMFETIYIEVDKTKMKEFGEAMNAHAKKFHSKAPYQVAIYNIATGPDSDKMVMVKGPLTFAQLDAEPDDGHGQHWREVVMPTLASVGNVEFWKRRDNWSKDLVGPRPLQGVRIMKLKKGQGHRVNPLFEKLIATIKEVDSDFNFDVYVNMFVQGDAGRHYGVVTGYNNWADLDKGGDGTFVKAFEKVNGANTYEGWVKEMNEVFVDYYDEYRMYIPYLSGIDN